MIRVAICRDARSVRPSPFKVTGLHVMSFYNGRTDRASLQRVTRLDVDRTFVPIVTRQVLNLSNGGKKSFHRWKNNFPPLEKTISSLGNFIFQAWKVLGKFTYRPRPASKPI